MMRGSECRGVKSVKRVLLDGDEEEATVGDVLIGSEEYWIVENYQVTFGNPGA